MGESLGSLKSTTLVLGRLCCAVRFLKIKEIFQNAVSVQVLPRIHLIFSVSHA